MIRTSITISPERKKRLVLGARELGISVSDLMAVLMHRSRVVCRSKRSVLWRAVQYQESLPGLKYLIMHVFLHPLCYEYGVSSRLAFKVSVSSIYAVMIDHFLDEIIKNGVNSPLTIDDLATSCFEVSYDVAYVDTPDNEYWIIRWDRRTKRLKKKRKKR